MADRPRLEERAIDERFVRASGPGGQNVNKVSTAVELRFNVIGSSLGSQVKVRLATLAGRRMQADGWLVVDSRTHRTQTQNREAARERLIELIAQASKRSKRRTPTRPSRAAKEVRLVSKKQQGLVKARRRRPVQEE
jgi:ribosome-associated protein